MAAPSPGRPRRARFRPGVTRGGDAAGTTPAAVTGRPRGAGSARRPERRLPSSASPPGPPPSSRPGSPHPGVLRSAPPADGELPEPRAAQTPRCPRLRTRRAGRRGRDVPPGLCRVPVPQPRRAPPHRDVPTPTPSPSRSLPCPSSGGRSAASLPGRRTDAKRRPSAVRRSSRLSSRCFEVFRSPAAAPKGCGQSRGLLGPPAACSVRDARRGRGRKRRGTGPGVNFIDCKNSTAAQ